MRFLGLGMVLVALTAGYLLMVRRFNVTELPSERHFGVTGQVEPAGEVYLEPISIDALNDAMQVRAYVSPSISESKSAHSASDRDLTYRPRRRGRLHFCAARTAGVDVKLPSLVARMAGDLGRRDQGQS